MKPPTMDEKPWTDRKEISERKLATKKGTRGEKERVDRYR